MFRACSLSFLLILGLGSVPGHAEHRDAATAGRIAGIVTAPDGRPAAGVQVVLDGMTVADASTRTNVDGRFRFDDVRPGRYELRVIADGLGADALPVTVEAGDVLDVTITLRVSPLQESIVVSASQVDRPRSVLGDSVTTFSEGDLRDRQTESVADALRLVPGFTVARNGGRGSVTSLFPRGGESDYTMVLLDGVRLNDFGGAFDFAHLPVEHAERVEVVRGPQSAIYGSDAIGGVVHVLTRHGGPPRVTGVAEGGSFGTTQLGASGAGSVNRWGWGGGVNRLATDGFTGRAPGTREIVSNDDYERTSVSASGGYLGAATQLTALAQLGQSDRGVPGPFGSDPNDTYESIDRISRGDDETTAFAVSGVHGWSTTVQARAQFTASNRDSQFLSPFGESFSDNSLRGFRAQVDYAGSPSLGASAGVETLGERAGNTFITNTAAVPVDVERRITGVFGEARWTRGPLFLTAGLRAERISRERLEGNRDPFAPRPDFDTDTRVSVDPKLAVAWLVRPSVSGEWTRVKASAGTGIRPPSAFEIAFTDNPSLAPERSRSFDVGVEQGVAGGRAVVEATYFFNNYDDLIVSVGRSFADASQFQTDNVSNARAQGVELSLFARPWSGLSLRVSYTWLETEILAVDGASGVAPPPFAVGDALLRRPRHRGLVDAVYHVGRAAAFARVDSRGDVLDVDPSLGAFGGLLNAPGFTVVDIGGSFFLWRGVAVTARVTNLFDRSYEEALGFPALGRSVMAGVRVASGSR
jgi:outer membrane cobalamin receptor